MKRVSIRESGDNDKVTIANIIMKSDLAKREIIVVVEREMLWECCDYICTACHNLIQTFHHGEFIPTLLNITNNALLAPPIPS